jgi:dUTP pyrophosphatase
MINVNNNKGWYNMKIIKVKYLSDINKIEKISIGNWIDLRCSEDVSLKQGEIKLIPLGIAVKLPDGYEANIVPRSSTCKKYGLLQGNSYGVVDNSYSGNADEWKFPVYATRDITIEKNTRVCQFRINKVMEEVEIVEVDDLGDNNRGGFGSTGEK